MVPHNGGMTNGMEPNGLPEVGDVDDLCRRYGVRRLDMFGSAVTGAFDPQASDLDFLVELDALDPAEYAESYFALRDGLAFLFGRPVDLVTEAGLANPYFRQKVLSQRKNLFLRR